MDVFGSGSWFSVYWYVIGDDGYFGFEIDVECFVVVDDGVMCVG